MRLLDDSEPTNYGSTEPEARRLLPDPEQSQTSGYELPDDSDPRERCCRSARVDGCWSWLIAVCSFYIIATVSGISFTSGVISEEIIIHFHLEQNVAKGSMPGTVLQGIYLIAGPLASVLSTIFGHRIVAVSGALLAITGFISASYASSIELLTLTYGVISGLGFSFLFFTSMVATTTAFDLWRSLAVGLATCGSGVGIFVYPQLARRILDSLGLPWCFQIQAAIAWSCLLVSLTFRPLNSRTASYARSACNALRSAFNLSLLRNPVFGLLLIMASSSTVGILIPFNYIPLSALERNLTEEQASWLVSIMGGTNTVGRLVVGAAALKAPFHPLVFMIASNTLAAAATFIILWLNSFLFLAIYCGLFGMVFAIDAVICTLALSRTLGEQNFSGSFGLFCLFRGVTAIAVTPLTGRMHDVTGHYEAGFYLSFSAFLLTAIVSLISFIVTRNQETAIAPPHSSIQNT